MNSWALMKKKHMTDEVNILLIIDWTTTSSITATYVPRPHALFEIECVDEWPEVMKSSN